MISYILNGQDTIICLIVGLIKKDMVKMSDYYPEPKSLGRRLKVELDFSNYCNKSRFKKCNRCWYIEIC